MAVTEQSRIILEKELAAVLPEFKVIEKDIPSLLQAFKREEKDNPSTFSDHPCHKFRQLFFNIDGLLKRLREGGVLAQELPNVDEIRGFIVDFVDDKVRAAAAKLSKSAGEFEWSKEKLLLTDGQRCVIDSFFMGYIPDELTVEEFKATYLPKFDEALTKECKEGEEYYYLNQLYRNPSSLKTLNSVDKTTQIPRRGDVRRYIILYLDRAFAEALKKSGRDLVECGWDKNKYLKQVFKDDAALCIAEQLEAKAWQWHEWQAQTPTQTVLTAPTFETVLIEEEQRLLTQNQALLAAELKASEEWVQIPWQRQTQLDNNANWLAARLQQAGINAALLSPSERANFGTWAVLDFLMMGHLTIAQARQLPVEVRTVLRSLGPDTTAKLSHWLLTPDIWPSLNSDEQCLLLLPGIVMDLVDRFFLSESKSELQNRVRIIHALSAEKKRLLVRPELRKFVTTMERFYLAQNLTLELIESIPAEWWSNYPVVIEAIIKGMPPQAFRDLNAIQLLALNSNPRCLHELIVKKHLSIKHFLELPGECRWRLEHSRDIIHGYNDLWSWKCFYVAKETNRVQKHCLPADCQALQTKAERFTVVEKNDLLFNLLRHRLLTGAELCQMGQNEFDNLASLNIYLEVPLTKFNDQLKYYPDQYEISATHLANFQQLKPLLITGLVDPQLIRKVPDLNPFALSERVARQVSVKSKESKSSSEGQGLFFVKVPVASLPALDQSEQKENPLLKYPLLYNSCKDTLSHTLDAMLFGKAEVQAFNNFREKCMRAGVITVLQEIQDNRYTSFFEEYFPEEGQCLSRFHSKATFPLLCAAWVKSGVADELVPRLLKHLVARMEKIIINTHWSAAITWTVGMFRKGYQIQTSQGIKKIDPDLAKIWQQVQSIKKFYENGAAGSKEISQEGKLAFGAIIAAALQVQKSSSLRNIDIDSIINQIIALQPLCGVWTKKPEPVLQLII